MSLTKVTQLLCKNLGINNRVLPMSDQEVRTIVHTIDGRRLSFQEYFVREQCLPEIKQFEFIGIETANPPNEVISSLNEADLVVICPSNPWVSIDPILKCGDIREILASKRVVAVSPIIGGKTIKGPAAKMFTELGFKPSALSVAEHYRDILSGFILDTVDFKEADQILQWGIMPKVIDTIMRSTEDRVQLAKETIEFGLSLPPKG
jgi:LPPG:FO 2-phospho-L-lactate transferase